VTIIEIFLENHRDSYHAGEGLNLQSLGFDSKHKKIGR